MMTLATHFRQRGFTLIEAIVVIVITGIIAGSISVFMIGPVKGYFDTARRAEMSDIADTALRRMARDIQAALPNSVRVSGSTVMEFVPMTAAGRYRSEKGVAVADDPLDFSAASDGSFDVLGPIVTLASGDSIVIFNMGQSGADVYDGTSRRAVAAPVGAVSKVTFTPGGTQFPYASPGSRFQVVSTAVTYACDGVGNLWRYSGYAIQNPQPTSIATLNSLAGVTKALIASNVTACSMIYTSGVLERNGLAYIKLAITEQGETVTLLHQVNVVNTP